MNLEKEILEIKERNTRVEADKAWETSLTRRLLIVTLTYFISFGWLLVINESLAVLKAIVPVFGYFISTWSLGLVKKMWYKKNRSL
ncbi:MAG: hypothetical protein JNN11_03025 [Candidatus Doudnabacteria bacterium]|nr:hypothetical protein [Candidatus Doudnabacteria bacterium]